MRFGGVLVRMKSESAMIAAASGTASHAAPTATNGCATIHPKMPPPCAIATAPSAGCGWPPNRWHRPLTLVSSSTSPMPRRPLSCTLDGCRNSHTAKISMMTGSA